jgi:hypothetical protein
VPIQASTAKEPKKTGAKLIHNFFMAPSGNTSVKAGLAMPQ